MPWKRYCTFEIATEENPTAELIHKSILEAYPTLKKKNVITENRAG